MAIGYTFTFCIYADKNQDYTILTKEMVMKMMPPYPYIVVDYLLIIILIYRYYTCREIARKNTYISGTVLEDRRG